MTKIKPFKAIRPTRDKAYLVATRPYYMYQKHVLEAKLDSNPFTFLHVINPEFHKEDRTEPNSPERFQKVRAKYEEFIKAGIFIRDEKESLYLYKQTKDGNEFLGLIGGASVAQYETGHIKKHEETLTSREETFSNYLKIVRYNAEPVLLFHEKKEGLDKIFETITQQRPEYEFSTTENIKHEIWVIDDPELIIQIQGYYGQIKDVYIADGHHRCASSARLCKEMGADENSPMAYFLAYFISDERMEILDYNRLVKDLNGLSKDEFLELVSRKFEVIPVKGEVFRPSQPHEISMYLDGQWYLLKSLPDTFDEDHPVDSLDTRILTKNILDPILNIQDLKTDDRIDFLNGKKGMIAIKEAIDSGEFKVGFGLFPVSVEQLKRVADENMIMPPKSTWIEPKMRSGLTIFPLD